MAVTDKGKDMEKCDVGAKGGDVTGERNNKEGGKPFINYNN